MVQPSSSSRRGDVRLATRVSQSPPWGLAGAGVAVLVMVLALASVVPRGLFFLGAAGLIAVAYHLDKRFKTSASADASSPLPAPPLATQTSTPAAPSPATTPTVSPGAPPLPTADLRAEHARLTQELTDRVDDDEDVRFEKFMRLRAIEQQLSEQPPQPPG